MTDKTLPPRALTMRSEAEMMQLILGYAAAHEDIRAVVLNGSRANPNACKDWLQDYDVVYFVTDVTPYRRSPAVPPAFGELMILQTPDDMNDPPMTPRTAYTYLMQFLDGNRIDLTFAPLTDLPGMLKDSQTVVLLDKDQCIGPLPPASDRDYLPTPPTVKAFEDCCNEFWWLNPYVAKGLWRGELTYAHLMLDDYLRGELLKMVTWYFGLRTGFQVAAGKGGKYLHTHLEPELWALLEQTYADADPRHTWEALFAMDELFRRTAQVVAAQFGCTYPAADDARVSAFLRELRDSMAA